MIPTLDSRWRLSSGPVSARAAWLSYRTARILLLEGYQRSLERRAAVAGLPRSATPRLGHRVPARSALDGRHRT